MRMRETRRRATRQGGNWRCRGVPWCVALLVAGVVIPAGVGAQPEIDHDNIVVILDASGSMEKPLQAGRMTRMQAAKGALREVLSKVPASTNVGILVFSGKDATGQALRKDWIYPLGPMDPAALANAIEKPEPAGRTPLGLYLKKGTDRLLEQRKLQKGYGTFRLLVVTDGDATDKPILDKHLPDVLSRGISVDVIGVDMDAQHSLATRVHSYRSANDSTSLQRAISEVFAEVGSSQDPASSDEAFEILAGLPDGMAAGVIGALTRSRDQPIGERPPAPPRQAPPRQSPQKPTDETPQSSSPSSRSTAPEPRNESESPVLVIVLMFGAFVVLAALVAVVRKAVS